MAAIFARALRSLPFLIFLLVLAVVIYFVLAFRSSPNHAKEVLIKLFTWIGIGTSALFALGCFYALLEKNDLAFEIMVSFLIAALIELAITRICRAVFLKHNPQYRNKPTKTKKERRQ